MAVLENLSTISFSEADLSELDSHINAIKDLFIDKGIEVLTPDEMRDFAKVAIERIGFIEMVYEDVKATPELRSPRVNQTLWDADHAAKEALQTRVTQAQNAAALAKSAQVMALFDMYQQANVCYRYVRLLAREGDGIAVTFYEKWKAQYERRGNHSDNGEG